MEETQEKYKENPPSLKHLVGINPTLIVIDMEEIARNIVKFDDEETPKDPLLSDLEARINELREENEEDDEGGLVVRT